MRHQLGGGEGLGHVVVGPRVVAGYLVGGGSARCEQQDGRAQVGASQLGGYGEPVFARKHDIEDDDVVLSCERVIDGFLPVVDEIGVVSVVLEDARERCGKGSIIFCDQYVRGPPRYRLRILGSHGSHCIHGSEKHLKVGRLRTFQVLFRNGLYDAFRCFPTPAAREWAEAIPARRAPPDVSDETGSSGSHTFTSIKCKVPAGRSRRAPGGALLGGRQVREDAAADVILRGCVPIDVTALFGLLVARLGSSVR